MVGSAGRVRPGTVCDCVQVWSVGRGGRDANTGLESRRSAVTAGLRRGGPDRRRWAAGGVLVVVGEKLSLVPAAVVLERVQDVLTVRVDEVGPRLPQRMNDVVDEADLQTPQHRIRTCRRCTKTAQQLARRPTCRRSGLGPEVGTGSPDHRQPGQLISPIRVELLIHLSDPR